MRSAPVDSEAVNKLFQELTITQKYFLKIANRVSQKLKDGYDFPEAVEYVLRKEGIDDDWDLWWSAIGSDLGSRTSYRSGFERQRTKFREALENRKKRRVRRFCKFYHEDPHTAMQVRKKEEGG